MKQLTKERLLELGITDVLEDGTVYYKGQVKKSNIIVYKHNNGNNKEYPAISLSDRNEKVKTIARYKLKNGEVKTYESWSYKVVNIPLARLMLAWFNGSIGEKEDADHIDNNPFNNNLSNLRAIDRKTNLAKRLTDHPEYQYTYFNQWHNLNK